MVDINQDGGAIDVAEKRLNAKQDLLELNARWERTLDNVLSQMKEMDHDKQVLSEALDMAMKYLGPNPWTNMAGQMEIPIRSIIINFAKMNLARAREAEISARQRVQATSMQGV